MRKFNPVLLVSLFLSLQGLAQERCGAMLNLEHRMAKDPKIEKNMNIIERQTQEYIANQHLKAGDEEVTIPVVVHIVYKSAAENISSSRVTSQIAVLNEDFRLMNADRNNAPAVFKSLQADIKVNFCLASVDPNGNPTTGITRTSTVTPQFTSTDDNVKHNSTGGRDAWPSNKYLNIWICALATPVGGVVGYAQFPGGDPSTDGIVIDYNYFGRESYSYGRTTTHEVGHWLNLRHIWGDQPCGDDFVSDTPTQLDKNFGCPSHPHASCTLSGDMFMNYMDYTDGNCQNMFSVGQKNRMRALFAAGGFREGLKTSNGCGNTAPVCSVPTGLGSSSITSSSATISWSTTSGANSYNVRYRTVGSATWNNTTSTTNSKALSGLASSSNYEFQIESVCSSGNSGFSSSATFTTGAASSCNAPTNVTTSGVTQNSFNLSWTAASGATSYEVQYKPSSGSTWTTATASGTSYTVSGLSAATTYNYQLRTVCGASFSSYTAQGSVTTQAASGGSTVTVGTGTTAFANAPYGTYYSDERSQFIITKAELMAAGYTGGPITLNSLSFNVTTASAQAMGGFTIRMGHTTATEFVTSSGLFGTTSFLSGANTTVYSGTHTAAANQWNKHTFSNPFSYNGTDNLLIEICWDNSTYSSNSTVLGSVVSNNRTLYYQSDVASGGNCTNATGTKTTTRPNMRIEYAGSSAMPSAVAEIGGTINANVFPNPANQELNVVFELDQPAKSGISLMNSLGQRVAVIDMGEKESGVHHQRIDLGKGEFSNLSDGVYILTLTTNAISRSFRLVIQR